MAKANTMGPMKIKESGGYRAFKVFNFILLTLISIARSLTPRPGPRMTTPR